MRLIPAVSFALSFALLPAKEKDQLTLANGDFFAGRVLALEDGVIKLQSPHSESPLQIVNDGLVQLSFSDQAQNAEPTTPLPPPPQELILKNGDRFPGELLSLDQKQATFKTWFTGDLQIPRFQIESLIFGVTPQKPVYRGPDGLDGWDQDGSRNWSAQDNKLIANQRSTIGRNFGLPLNFIFRSTINWSDSPSCRIHICSQKTDLEQSNVGDSYLVSLSASGLQLQRVSIDEEGETSYQQLINNSVSLRSRKSKQVELEIQVDRTTRMIDLFLDGEKVGQGYDPREAPSGSSIIFESLNHTSGDMIVSAISIDEWDTNSRALQLEERADNDLDTLAIQDGDRFSGQVISYEPAAGNESFAIKTTLAPDPIVIPLQHCSVLYFAADETLTEASGRYLITLRTGGRLTVSKIKLGPESLTATHPWLGELKIDRRAMQSITKG